MEAMIINKKTIVVWNNLEQNEVAEIENVLTDIIREYQRVLHGFENLKGNLSIPIPIDKYGNYLSVVQKNGNILVYTSKNKNNAYVGVPIINEDEIYAHIGAIRRLYKKTIEKMSNIFSKNHEAWIHIKYTQDTESFLLSPTPNPEDFVASLSQEDLPQMYRDFLCDVGLALPKAKEIEIPEDDYGL